MFGVSPTGRRRDWHGCDCTHEIKNREASGRARPPGPWPKRRAITSPSPRRGQTVPGGAATVRLEGQHLILEILVVFQVDNFKMKFPCGVAADSTAMMLMFSR